MEIREKTKEDFGETSSSSVETLSRAEFINELMELRQRAAELEAADTERKRAEVLQATRALRESEARYRAIVEDQTELICRFLPDGTLTFVNGAYCRYFGRKREELVGSSFMLYIPAILSAKLAF